MFNFIKKAKQKKTFQEYGSEIDTFNIEGYGKIEYAQWQHPFEKPKTITTDHINFYKKLSRKGGMIIDIGAHAGDTTVPMALAVEKEGIVLGIEPNKYVYKILEKNAALNPDITNIKPHCFAVTEEDGDFTFHYSDASFCNGGFLSEIESNKHNHNYRLDVKGVALIPFLEKNYKEELKNLHLVKIDAEGYDKEIIKSIAPLLKEYHPNMMVECYKKLNSEERDELFSVIDQLGYHLFYLENFESLGTLDRLQKEDMNHQKHFEMLAIHENKIDQFKNI